MCTNKKKEKNEINIPNRLTDTIEITACTLALKIEQHELFRQ